MLDISDDNHAAIVHQRRHCRAGPGVVFAVRLAACGGVQNTLRNLSKYFAQAAWPHCTYSIVTLAKVTSEC